MGEKIGQNAAGEDIATVLAAAMDNLIKLSGAERGLIILFNETGDHIYQTARNLNQEDIARPAFEISNTVIEKVRADGNLIYYRDAFSEPALEQSKSVTRLKILSVICLPLIHKNNVIGVAYLDNRTIQGRFTQEVCDIVETFGSLITLSAYHALEGFRLKEDKIALQEELRHRSEFDTIVGHSPQMQRVLQNISDVANTEVRVLIEGESGTGKELVAKAIHISSQRKDKPLITVNCGAFPDTLLESEFFGYERGAFTGALNTYRGKFELADGGTLFLDEVNEMSPALQVKLLRTLQSGEYTPLGSEKIRNCDVRIIAATNMDLKNLVAERKFRQDLYYRLNIVRIEIPPLTQRKEDIMVLANYFLSVACKKLSRRPLEIGAEVKEILLNYNFPGNVRELENLMHRSAIFCKGKILKPEHLPDEISLNKYDSEKSLSPVTFKAAKKQAVEKFERNFLLAMLHESEGNIRKAALRAGMHEKNFHEKLKKYEIR